MVSMVWLNLGIAPLLLIIVVVAVNNAIRSAVEQLLDNLRRERGLLENRIDDAEDRLADPIAYARSKVDGPYRVNAMPNACTGRCCWVPKHAYGCILSAGGMRSGQDKREFPMQEFVPTRAVDDSK